MIGTQNVAAWRCRLRERMNRLWQVALCLCIGLAPAYAQSTPREEEVTFTNGTISLAGTISVPQGAGPFPAVVLLTGSGAQNRDEEIFGFKVFKVVADHLAQHGVVVLRYDDRGVGGSSGSIPQSTTEDFAGDALAGLALLAKRQDVNPKRIGLIGHSEGAIAAAIAAARSSDVAFIVMIAGPAISGAEVLAQQARDSAVAGGADEAAVSRIVTARAALSEAIRADASDEKVLEAVRVLARAQIDAAPEAQRKLVGDVDAFIERLLKTQSSAMRGPWMRFFVAFNPATALARVSCPVLAVYGGRDVQVPVALHRPPLEKALAGNKAATVKVYPEANHLFQSAKTGSPAEYSTLDKQFVPGLLDDISTWIAARAR